MLLDVCQLSRNVIEFGPLLRPGLYIVSQIVGCPVILS